MSDAFRPDPLPARVESAPVEERPELHPERFCPNCGTELAELGCKLICPNRQCGYALSCSDFY